LECIEISGASQASQFPFAPRTSVQQAPLFFSATDEFREEDRMVSFPPQTLNVQNPRVPKILSSCCRQNAALIVVQQAPLFFSATDEFREEDDETEREREIADFYALQRHPADKDRWVVRRSAMRVAEGGLGVDQGGYDPFFEPHLVPRFNKLPFFSVPQMNFERKMTKQNASEKSLISMHARTTIVW
jgi:hypothetical protein